ncbi:MAG: RND family efflux transporter MFP subunit, partial [Bradymonadia bacterium]
MEFTGELLARDVVALAPDVSGRLAAMLVDEGDSVTAGQRIASLDDEATRRQRAEATARVASAQARVAQAEAQRAQDANEVGRREPLVAQNAFPASELARLRDALAVTEQSVDVARAQVSEAEASLNSLRTALNHTEMTAPFSGLVTERHVTVGAMVSPQSPVLTLVDEASLRFVFRVPEDRLRDLDAGTVAMVQFDAYPEREFEATVSHLGQVVDRESRTVEVRLRVEAAGAVLRHGMF